MGGYINDLQSLCTGTRILGRGEADDTLVDTRGSRVGYVGTPSRGLVVVNNDMGKWYPEGVIATGGVVG